MTTAENSAKITSDSLGLKDVTHFLRSGSAQGPDNHRGTNASFSHLVSRQSVLWRLTS